MGPWRAGLNTAHVNGINPLQSDAEAFSSPGHIPVADKIPSDQKLCSLHSQIPSLSVCSSLISHWWGDGSDGVAVAECFGLGSGRRGIPKAVVLNLSRQTCHQACLS